VTKSRREALDDPTDDWSRLPGLYPGIRRRVFLHARNGLLPWVDPIRAVRQGSSSPATGRDRLAARDQDVQGHAERAAGRLLERERVQLHAGRSDVRSLVLLLRVRR